MDAKKRDGEAVDSTPAKHDGPLTAEYFNTPGALSIVLQGPLFVANVAEMAVNCEHWRLQFPQAQIILSISVSDFLYAEGGTDLNSPFSVFINLLNRSHLFAWSCIKANCDRIIMSGGDLALPPLKFDSKANNGNLQIASAKAGLANAAGKYTMRIRADMLFSTNEFLDYYVKNCNFVSSHPKHFDRRVMVSHIYTLNPYTIERMPFHISDLFHFGLTSDLRKIWSCPPISYADSVYYQLHSHARHSNEGERQFRARLAVEQHVHFHVLKDADPSLKLEYHNDLSSREKYLEVLATDFVVCDLRKIGVIFGKYSYLLDPRKTYLSCISNVDWRRLAQARNDGISGDIFAQRFAMMKRKHAAPEQHRVHPVARIGQAIRGLGTVVNRRARPQENGR